LVALTIAVMLAAAWPFAAPRLFPAQQLRNEGQRLISALRAARMSARLSGATQEMEILNEGSLYRAGVEARTLPSGVTARMRTAGLPATSDRMMFYSDGSSSGGVIDLVLPDRHLSVQVGKLTGRAEMIE
jgi:hypothetical protein